MASRSKLPADVQFKKGPYPKKYTAIFTDPVSKKQKRVHFGDRRYQHFKDSVPKSRGGRIWSKLDHGDANRRKNYRKRHAGMKCKDGRRCIDKKYSPSWFSYYYLW